ncbi:unnamed protein product [Zymoseptoria tritici ST99CH_1E4]|uniref:Uncharacterized protein n=1 Tax=Zymoseptoria tritici ST99CH_1E4 TaxID=1276532 RepID=A0A2H1GFX5_ZYMTR|nr:unnamed protein product [Zymoseptoria tritici ST99CH_1E4]
MGGAISFESNNVAGAVSLGPPFLDGMPVETQPATFLTSYGFDPGNTNFFGILATVSVVENPGFIGALPASVTPLVTFPIGEPITTIDDDGSTTTATPTSVVTCTEFNDGLLPSSGEGAATDQLTCQIPNTAIAPGIVTLGFLGPSQDFGDYYTPQYVFSVASSTLVTSIETSTSTSFVAASIVASTTVTDTSYLATVRETPTTTLTGALSTSYVSCSTSTSPSSSASGTASITTDTASTSSSTASTTIGTASTTTDTTSATTGTAATSTGTTSVTTSTASTNTNTASTNTEATSTTTRTASTTTAGAFEATQAVFILEAYGVPRIPDGSDGAIQTGDTFRFAASNTGTLLALLENGHVVDSSGRAASVPTSRGLRKRQESTNGSRIFFAAADDDSFEACDCDISSNDQLSCTCDSLSGLIIGTSGDLLGVLAIGRLDGFKECAPVAVVDPQSSTSGSVPTYPAGGSIPDCPTGGSIPAYANGGSIPAYAADGSTSTYAADGSVPTYAADGSISTYGKDAAGNFKPTPTTLVTKVVKTVTVVDCDSEGEPTPALHRRQTTTLDAGFSGPDFTFSEGNNVATVTRTETSMTTVSTLIVSGTASTVTEVVTSGIDTTTVTSAETTTTLSTTATQDDRTVSTVTGCAPTVTVR